MTMVGDLRIHGDNIIECERLLHLLAESLDVSCEFSVGPLYAPTYNLKKGRSVVGTVQLLPGYKRWGVDIQEILEKNGAHLREAADAILTKIDKDIETIVFSIEFSTALPAGNNAWQRMGRALSSAEAKVPYIYYTELGGIELNAEREKKATRYPNPIIPFAYLTLNLNYSSLSIPVYLPSPVITKEVMTQFSDVFGLSDCKELIKCLVLGLDASNIKGELVKKTLSLINKLSASRKRLNTLKPGEWERFLALSNVQKRASWIDALGIKWEKKTISKVNTTATFRTLLSKVLSSNFSSIGARDIPICLITEKKRKAFVSILKAIYGSGLNYEFYDWIDGIDLPMLVVWITGFKPKGEDSRPDRGLVPLARMLFGPEINILAIVYGPAPANSWTKLKDTPKELAHQNGLWQSIINLSDAILADSSTMTQGPFGVLTNNLKIVSKNSLSFSTSKVQHVFSEQDIDSVVHFAFTNSGNALFECMCNPPGGDWSGILLMDFDIQVIYRWTSLPRVSNSNRKRPDHVVEIKTNRGIVVLSIESKEKSEDFESLVGPKLEKYVQDLISTVPNAAKAEGVWSVTGLQKFDKKLTYLSGGAYQWRNEQELNKVMNKGKFNFVFAFDFNESVDNIILHVAVKGNNNLEKLIPIIFDRIPTLKVQIHRL